MTERQKAEVLEGYPGDRRRAEPPGRASNSFYPSAAAAGVTDTLIPNFAAAFTYYFSFQREIHPGDVF